MEPAPYVFADISREDEFWCMGYRAMVQLRDRQEHPGR